MYQSVSRRPEPVFLKPAASVREREILRVSGWLIGTDQDRAMHAACDAALKWAEKKAVSKFAPYAWKHQSFEQLSSGRSRVAVRLEEVDATTWAMRVEDPDQTIPGRIWTTEITLRRPSTGDTKLTIRQLVGSPELTLQEVEPHVPGVVRQIIQNPGLQSGKYRLIDRAVPVQTEADVNLLIDALVDPARTLPIIVASVPSSSNDLNTPLIDMQKLAAACAGLATVIILPSRYTWFLSERFGTRLSVFEGAVRIYLPGFTEDANPFSGHDLIMADRFASSEGAAVTLKRLRWSAALGSVTRLSLGTDVLTFASLRLKSLEQQQLALENGGASEREQLTTALNTIKVLEERVLEEKRFQQEFSTLHEAAEDRARAAESQLSASGFRIRQLLEQLQHTGTTPDATIKLPNTWKEFADWCDTNLAGRVLLSPQARRSSRDSVFEDVQLAARCLLWLANDYVALRTSPGDGSLRDREIEPGILNAHCGNDEYNFDWQSGKHAVQWHIKNRGNTRKPERCLRIYYFWDDNSQQTIIARMPEHLRTDAS